MHVFLIVATTSDGFIAEQQDQKSTHWTSREDFAFFQKRTKEAGLIVMGSTTYRTIGHPLKDRITIVITNHPETIADSRDILDIRNWPLEITTSVWTTDLNPSELVELLDKKMYPELALCGGSSIYTQFADAGLIDTAYLTVEKNIIFGQGVTLFTHPINLGKPTTITPLSPTTDLEEYDLS